MQPVQGTGAKGHTIVMCGLAVKLHFCLLSLQEAKAMFTDFDKDGNGTISFEEFLQKLRVSL